MDLIYKPGDVLTGSNKLTDIEKETISREEYMVLHASENKAIEFYKEKYDDELIAASDAFFPFVDGFEKLVQAGISAVIQPSGSIKDKEIIKFANQAGIILVFSKTRHFRH